MAEKIPETNQFYRARGFVFRVDEVRDGYVLYCRWPNAHPDGEHGELCRIEIADWLRDIAGAEMPMCPDCGESCAGNPAQNGRCKDCWDRLIEDFELDYGVREVEPQAREVG